MAREFSEDVRIRVKDGIRELRSFVRKHRHDHAPYSSIFSHNARGEVFPFREFEGIIGHAVSAFDDVMTIAESLAPRGGPASLAAPAPHPMQTYFRLRGNAQLEGKRAFRRDLYRMAKLALEQKNLSDFRIRELDFAMVHEALEKREAARIARLHEAADSIERERLTAAITASLFLLLVFQRPIRLATAPTYAIQGGRLDDEAVLVLAAIAIACGLATLDLEGAPGSELVEIAILAVGARADRIRSAMKGDDAQEKLAALFAKLLAHLN